MTEHSEEWELIKENIQPIQKGRKFNVLKAALQVHADQELEQQRKIFEQELRTYSGDDPLSVWYSYIQWVEQNFPKGGREGNIGQLIHQCLTVLKDGRKYCNDKRFVEIWLKYANFSIKPLEIYAYMFSQNIGCEVGKFYISWAWELEQQRDIKRADEVLMEGIQRSAQPVESIQSAHSQFQMRIANLIKKDIESGHFENDLMSSEQRSAFGILTAQGKKHTAPISRIEATQMEKNRIMTLGGQQPQPKSSISLKEPFVIYNDENAVPSLLPGQSQSSSSFMPFSASSKENEKKPRKWTKVKVKQGSCAAATEYASKEPAFAFHVDDLPQPEITPRKLPEGVHVLSSRKCPLNPPAALFEPPDPMRRPMYNKIKVYGGAEEFSFEEIRAAVWFEKQRKLEKEKKRIQEEKEKDELKKQLKYMQEQMQLLQMRILSSQTSRPDDQLQPSGNSNHSNEVVENSQTSHPLVIASGSTENNSYIFTDSLKGKTFSPGFNYQATSSEKRNYVQEGCNEESLKSTNGELSAPVKELIPVVSSANNSHSLSSLVPVQSNFNTPTATGFTKEALYLVRELYNESLFKCPDDDILRFETSCEISGDGKKNNQSKIASNLKAKNFTITGDSNTAVANISSIKPAMMSVSKNQLQQPLGINVSLPDTQRSFVQYNTSTQSDNFTIYQDPKNNQNYEVVLPDPGIKSQPFTVYEDPEQDENSQNIPPPGYVQEHNTRELAGILQPSLNIPYIPLEKQLEEEENDGDEDDIEEFGFHIFPDVNAMIQENMTLVPPQSSEQFAANARFVSTPFIKNSNNLPKSLYSDLTSNTSSALMPPPGETALPSKLSNAQSSDHLTDSETAAKVLPLRNIPLSDFMPTNSKKVSTSKDSNQNSLPSGDLSVIMESSRENYSKLSSSSSSSSASSMTGLGVSHHHFNQQHSSLHRYASKAHPASANDTSKISENKSSINSLNKVRDVVGNMSGTVDSNFKRNESKNDNAEALILESMKNGCDDIDPFDPDIQNQLLSSLPTPIYTRDNFYVSTASMKSVKISGSIKLGNDHCLLESIHAEGAYAKLYVAQLRRSGFGDFDHNLSSTKRVALKMCKSASTWEYYVCSEVQQRLSELSILPDVKDSVMKITSATLLSDGIILMNEFCKFGTIVDIVNLYKKHGTSVPECLIMYFTLEMLQIMSQVHQCDIVHGDIKPDNFLLVEIPETEKVMRNFMRKTSCLRLIDFGRGIDLRFFKPGTAFRTVVKSNCSKCIEMRENRPWIYQADWFGILGCIHVLLFTEYMSVQKNKEGYWETTNKFKRYWEYNWQSLFHTLLNIPNCDHKPDLKPFIKELVQKVQQTRDFSTRSVQLSSLLKQQPFKRGL